MSKYNNSKSIPVESLSPEELKIAIKEWAEGIEGLERLLWSFYNKGIKTSGCHAGPSSYIGVYYDSKYDNEIASLIDYTIMHKGSMVMAKPDAGNPFSGPDWYKPNITIGCETPSEEACEKGFGLLADAIEDKIDATSPVDSSPLMEFMKFFVGKCSGLTARITHFDDEYMFSIEAHIKDERLLFNYLNSTLGNLGFTLRRFDEATLKSWDFKTKDSNELNSKIRETINKIISTYTLDVPTDINDVDSFSLKALILKNRSQEEFEEWLAEQNRIMEENYKKRMEEKKHQK